MHKVDTLTIDRFDSFLPLARLELIREEQMEPALEKDSFSGGVNESARNRNEDRLDACSVYVFGSSVIGPEHLLSALSALNGTYLPMRRKHPALVSWLAWWRSAFTRSRDLAQMQDKADKLLREVDALLGNKPCVQGIRRIQGDY